MKGFPGSASQKHLISQELDSTETARPLKSGVKHKINFKTEDQSFSFRSSPLNNSKKAKDNGIEDESVIGSLHLRRISGTKESPKKTSPHKQISKKKSDMDEIIKPKKDLLPNDNVDIDELRDQYIKERRRKKNKVQEEIISLEEDGIINAMVLSKDNTFVVYGISSSIKVFDFKIKKEHYSFENVHMDNVLSVAISNDNQFIISGSMDKSIKIFDLHTKRDIYHFKDAHKGAIFSVAISNDNRFIVSGSEDQSIKVFDFESKQVFNHFQDAHTSD